MSVRAAVPYAVESDEESDAQLRRICEGFRECEASGDLDGVAGAEVAVAAAQWTRELRAWLRLKRPIPMPERRWLTRWLWNAALDATEDAVADRFAGCCCALWKPRFGATVSSELETEDSPVDWSKLLQATLNMLRHDSTPLAFGHHAVAALGHTFGVARWDASTVEESFKAIVSHLGPDRDPVMVLRALTIALPVPRNPPLHTQDLILKGVFNIWALLPDSDGDREVLVVLGRAVRGPQLLTDAQMAAVTAALLRVLDIPLASRGTQSRRPASIKSDKRVFRAYGTLVSANWRPSVSQQVRTLVEAVETFCHPSNAGPYTLAILDVISEVANAWSLRVNTVKHTTDVDSNPSEAVDAKKTTENGHEMDKGLPKPHTEAKATDEIVRTLLGPVLLGLHARSPVMVDASLGALQTLASLSPGIVMPQVLREAYATLQNPVAESHRAMAALSALAHVAGPLARIAEWRLHISTLAELALPRISAVDSPLAATAFAFIHAIALATPLAGSEDASLASVYIPELVQALQDVESSEHGRFASTSSRTDSESAQIDYEAVWLSSTAAWAEVAPSLLDRALGLVDALPDAPGADSAVLAGALACIGAIAAGVSPDVHARMLARVLRAVADDYGGGDAHAQLVGAIVRTRPATAFPKAWTTLVPAVRHEVAENGAGSGQARSGRDRDRAFVRLLGALNMTILGAGDALLPMRGELIELLRFLRRRTGHSVVYSVANTIHHAIATLATTRWIGDDQWYVPTRESLELAADLYLEHSLPPLPPGSGSRTGTDADSSTVTGTVTSIDTAGTYSGSVAISTDSTSSPGPGCSGTGTTPHSPVRDSNTSNDGLSQSKDSTDPTSDGRRSPNNPESTDFDPTDSLVHARVATAAAAPLFIRPVQTQALDPQESTKTKSAQELGIVPVGAPDLGDLRLVLDAHRAETGRRLAEHYRQLPETAAMALKELLFAAKVWFADIGAEHSARPETAVAALYRFEARVFRVPGARNTLPSAVLGRRAALYHATRLAHNASVGGGRMASPDEIELLHSVVVDACFSAYAGVRRNAYAALYHAVRALEPSVQQAVIYPKLLARTRELVAARDFAKAEGGLGVLSYRSLPVLVHRGSRRLAEYWAAVTEALDADWAALNKAALASFRTAGSDSARLVAPGANSPGRRAAEEVVGTVTHSVAAALRSGSHHWRTQLLEAGLLASACRSPQFVPTPAVVNALATGLVGGHPGVRRASALGMLLALLGTLRPENTDYMRISGAPVLLGAGRELGRSGPVYVSPNDLFGLTSNSVDNQVIALSPFGTDSEFGLSSIGMVGDASENERNQNAANGDQKPHGAHTNVETSDPHPTPKAGYLETLYTYTELRLLEPDDHVDARSADLVGFWLAKSGFQAISGLPIVKNPRPNDRQWHRVAAEVMLGLVRAARWIENRDQFDEAAAQVFHVAAESLAPENVAFWAAAVVLAGADLDVAPMLAAELVAPVKSLDVGSGTRDALRLSLAPPRLLVNAPSAVEPLWNALGHELDVVRIEAARLLARTLARGLWNQRWPSVSAFVGAPVRVPVLEAERIVAELQNTSASPKRRRTLVRLLRELLELRPSAVASLLPRGAWAPLLWLSTQRDDPELVVDATHLWAGLGSATVASEDLEDAVHMLVAEPGTTWHQNMRMLLYVQGFYFGHLFTLSAGQRRSLTDSVVRELANAQVEVRTLAAATLSGIVRCSPDRAVLVTELSDRFQRELAANTERIPRHAAVLGLGALVTAFPYVSPPPRWIPEVLATLAVRAAGDRGVVGASVKQILGDFKRTRQDTWPVDQTVFSAEQLDDLDGVLWKNYFA